MVFRRCPKNMSRSVLLDHSARHYSGAELFGSLKRCYAFSTCQNPAGRRCAQPHSNLDNMRPRMPRNERVRQACRGPFLFVCRTACVRVKDAWLKHSIILLRSHKRKEHVTRSMDILSEAVDLSPYSLSLHAYVTTSRKHFVSLFHLPCKELGNAIINPAS